MRKEIPSCPCRFSPLLLIVIVAGCHLYTMLGVPEDASNTHYTYANAIPKCGSEINQQHIRNTTFSLVVRCPGDLALTKLSLPSYPPQWRRAMSRAPFETILCLTLHAECDLELHSRHSIHFPRFDSMVFFSIPYNVCPVPV